MYFHIAAIFVAVAVVGRYIVFGYTEDNWKLVAIYKRPLEGRFHVVVTAEGTEKIVEKAAEDTHIYRPEEHVNVLHRARDDRDRNNQHHKYAIFYLDGAAHSNELDRGIILTRIGMVGAFMSFILGYIFG